MEHNPPASTGQDYFTFAASHHAARVGLVDIGSSHRHVTWQHVQPATQTPSANSISPATGPVGSDVAPSSAFESVGSGGGAGAANAAPPAADSAYLEQSLNPVTPASRKEIASRIVACSVGCKSRFCPNCCVALGIKLKQKLIPVLNTFKAVMMLTFTIDPELFPGPREALEYVQRHRCLSVTMQALKRAGVLISTSKTPRYFAVIEWQDNGWPHWHVLVEATHIPFATLKNAWNANLNGLGIAATSRRVGFWIREVHGLTIQER